MAHLKKDLTTIESKNITIANLFRRPTLFHNNTIVKLAIQYLFLIYFRLFKQFIE